MKDFKIYVILASLIMVVYLVAEYKRPKPINWTASFNKTDKIPLGTFILYNQLHDIFPGAAVQPYREPVYNVLNDHGIKNATYVIVSNRVNLTEYDYKKLSAFIKQGNDVFIAATDFGDYLTKELNVETNENYDLSGKTDSIHFLNKRLNPHHFYTVSKELQKTSFYNFDTAKVVVLAKNNEDNSTFIKLNMGRGTLYLNTNPHLFTNYSLLNPDGADYAAKALSQLKYSKTILWDDYYSLGREGEQSEMRVFLNTPSLRWAYYITLLGLLFFVLYQMKRRQRIIPVIEPLRNSSVDFATVVGQVYYEQRDNSNIALKKATYFLEHLRTKYHLKTSVLDNEFATALAQKSGAEAGLIHKLINELAIVRSGAKISDNDLIALNRNIERFYIQSK